MFYVISAKIKKSVFGTWNSQSPTDVSTGVHICKIDITEVNIYRVDTMQQSTNHIVRISFISVMITLASK